MKGLEHQPSIRASILVLTTGLKQKIAIKKSWQSAAEDLQISLDEGETDAESIVAVDVQRKLSPGKDPTKEVAPLAVDLYARSGAVRVKLGDDPPLDLQAPAERALIGDGIASPGETPAWVTSEALSTLDRNAVQAVEGMLPPDQFVGLILKELSTHRRRPSKLP